MIKVTVVLKSGIGDEVRRVRREGGCRRKPPFQNLTGQAPVDLLASTDNLALLLWLHAPEKLGVVEAMAQDVPAAALHGLHDLWISLVDGHAKGGGAPDA